MLNYFALWMIAVLFCAFVAEYWRRKKMQPFSDVISVYAKYFVYVMLMVVLLLELSLDMDLYAANPTPSAMWERGWSS